MVVFIISTAGVSKKTTSKLLPVVEQITSHLNDLDSEMKQRQHGIDELLRPFQVTDVLV